MMTDSAYINPSERERYHFERKTEGKISGLVHKDQANYSVAKLRASHAVVDSIAAELAERMRPLIEFAERTAIDYDDLAASKACRQAVDTLARFDALKGTQ